MQKIIYALSLVLIARGVLLRRTSRCLRNRSESVYYLLHLGKCVNHSIVGQYHLTSTLSLNL